MSDIDQIDLVVVGLGYVGLPLVQAAVQVGLKVKGLDLDGSKVERLNAGESVIDDLSDGDVAELRRAGFVATTDESCLAGANTAVICVPTPLNADGIPNLEAVRSATSAITRHLHPGMLVVLESTTYPGTTNDVVRPILETAGLAIGTDVHLAYSPERIDPGNPTFGLRNTPKVVGGYTDACRDEACRFYGKFIDEVVPTRGLREAEMAKLLENTYRHVNIALMNEMAVFCQELQVDLWDAIRAASTKPFGFQAFHPGPGVGGHCIPIDPNYLSYSVRRLGTPFRFVELAQEINARMPAYVLSRIQRLLNTVEQSVKGSTVLLLGVTYKADIADERESPAVPLAEGLLRMGANVTFHDPHVPQWQVADRALERTDLDRGMSSADLVVLLQAHSSYDLGEVAQRSRLVLDTRGVMDAPNVERL